MSKTERVEVSEARPLLAPIPEVQKALGGVSRSTVYELLDGAELDSVKIGARRLVTWESVCQLVQRRSDRAVA